MELSWSSGRILREYTVLLDPVEIGSQQIASANTFQQAERIESPLDIETVPAANVANGGSTVTITAHGFGEIGQVMSFQLSTDGTLPTGYSPGIDYLFEIVNANTIRALVNQRRGPDTFTDQGTGNHTFTPYTKTNNLLQ